MSRSMPDPFEGLVLPILVSIAIVILCKDYPSTMITIGTTVGIIVGTSVIAFLVLLVCDAYDLPVWLPVGNWIGISILAVAMYFLQIPVLTIGGIMVEYSVVLCVGLTFCRYFEVHILGTAAVISATLAVGSLTYIYMEDGLLSAIAMMIILIVAFVVGAVLYPHNDLTIRRIRQCLIVVFALGWFVVLWVLVNLSGIQVKKQESFAFTPIGYVVTIVCAILFFLPILFLTHKNWRCPSCGAYLGLSLFPILCPSCGRIFS